MHAIACRHSRVISRSSPSLLSRILPRPFTRHHLHSRPFHSSLNWHRHDDRPNGDISEPTHETRPIEGSEGFGRAEGIRREDGNGAKGEGKTRADRKNSKQEEHTEAYEVILEREEATKKRDAAARKAGEAENATDVPDPGLGEPDKPKNRSHYGSATRRAQRNVKKATRPKLTIPAWFLERNVRIQPLDDGSKDSVYPAPYLALQLMTGGTTKKDHDMRASSLYQIDANVFFEVASMAHAGLRPTSPEYVDYPGMRPHLLLHCPNEGGNFFLEAVVNHIARAKHTDVITIGAQDIADLADIYMGYLEDGSANALQSLGYDTYLSASNQNNQEAAEEDRDEDGDSEVEEGTALPPPFQRPGQPVIHRPPRTAVMTFLGSVNISDILNASQSPHVLRTEGAPNSSSETSTTKVQPEDMLSEIIDVVLDAPRTKRRMGLETAPSEIAKGSKGEAAETAVSSEDISMPEPAQPNAAHDSSHSDGLIILVRDYAAMASTRSGSQFLNRLHTAVQTRRQRGQRVLIIGATSSNAPLSSWSRSDVRSVEHEYGHGPYHTILVPCVNRERKALFERLTRSRTKSINLHHLSRMIEKLSSPSEAYEPPSTTPTKADLRRELEQLSEYGLSDSIWPVEQVNRTAMMVVANSDANLTGFQRILVPLQQMHVSNAAKKAYLSHEKERQKSVLSSMASSASLAERKKMRDDRLKELRQICNPHERKLLHGVVDAASITTTFADVHVPPETIQALQTLTSLSLLRPEAFTYGVLATDTIPGLLLYGPPGTGKTLLARAVARESGATVLDVSGSDLYDKYVGEGEKNVRAIFTLARKLTPCVVFIDEADALFGSRGSRSTGSAGSGGRGSSHHDLINQFLREWDGMNPLSSAFIMVATNRPFDLDDAVLRRLPRRLLVDLPTEREREAILRIHLRGEVVGGDVGVGELAGGTGGYSGSDLKNLVVAAALRAVREEVDGCSSSGSLASSASSSAEVRGESDSSSLEVTESDRDRDGHGHGHGKQRRVLARRHFLRAMGEVGASVSEDGGSLAALRRFDEMFGERRGRRKRFGLGFGAGGRDGNGKGGGEGGGDELGLGLGDNKGKGEGEVREVRVRM